MHEPMTHGDEYDGAQRIRHDWSAPEVQRAVRAAIPGSAAARAERAPRRTTPPNTVQMSTLLSIKTGACPEDCAYCPQSVRYDTGLSREALMEVAAVRRAPSAPRRPAPPASAWARPTAPPRPATSTVIAPMVREVRALGLESCATLGMLEPGAGATAEGRRASTTTTTTSTPRAEFYGEIITTRTYQDRLDTLGGGARGGPEGLLRRHRRHGRVDARPRRSCSRRSRPCRSTRRACRSTSWCRCRARRCADARRVDPFDFVRTIAVARIADAARACAPVRGPHPMSDEMQALCFLAGANSIFYGEKLLTTGNPDVARDRASARAAGADRRSTAARATAAGAAARDA